MSIDDLELWLEWQQLIEAHETTIAYLRREWMKGNPKDEKHYQARIDAALDERLRLMAIRDEIA